MVVVMTACAFRILSVDGLLKNRDDVALAVSSRHHKMASHSLRRSSLRTHPLSLGVDSNIHIYQTR